MFLNFRNTHKKTPVLESPPNKAAGLEAQTIKFSVKDFFLVSVDKSAETTVSTSYTKTGLPQQNRDTKGPCRVTFSPKNLRDDLRCLQIFCYLCKYDNAINVNYY